MIQNRIFVAVKMNLEHFRRLCEILFTSKFAFVSISKSTADTAVAVLQYFPIPGIRLLSAGTEWK